MNDAPVSLTVPHTLASSPPAIEFVGVVKVNGELVTGPNKYVAFMLQKDLLMPWRTIAKNVEFGLELRGFKAAQRADISARLLEQCRLKGYYRSYPHQLSAGMSQRSHGPHSGGRPAGAADRGAFFCARRTARGGAQKTMLFITHGLAEAVALSDRILVMSERSCTIVEEITVNIADRARGFITGQLLPVNGGFVLN